MARMNTQILRGGVLLLTLLWAVACVKNEEAPSSRQVSVPTAEQVFQSTLKTAEAGDAKAQFDAAKAYNNGEGVPKDIDKAIEWYQKAADQGNADAQNALGLAFKSAKDDIKAIEWFRKAADQGHADAQLNLGRAYFSGVEVVPEDKDEDVFVVVPKDVNKAIEWWRKAADQGFAEAQMALGRAYRRGNGVPLDIDKATEWFRKAADQGDADAQTSLAGAYSSLAAAYILGRGVPKDDREAAEWYRKAADQGYADAQISLATAYYSGRGVPKDYGKAAEWFGKAAAQGDESGRGWLGSLYEEGHGVAKDLVIAYAWYNLNAVADKEWREFRDGVGMRLTKDELSEAQRLSSAWKPGQLIEREDAASGNAIAQNSSGSLRPAGTGTLFVVGKDGHAVTNHHVVAGCAEMRVESMDGTLKVVTTDPVNDLALLILPAKPKATAKLVRDMSKIRQGDNVVVYGFPLN